MTIRSLSASRSYESKSEPKLNIIVADLLPDRLKIIRDCLSVLKKCDFTVCRDQQTLMETARNISADLFLISFEIIQNDCLSILNHLRQEHPKTYIIVYADVAQEQMRNTLLMAGATECLLLGPEDVNLIAESGKKALASMSETEYSDGSMEAHNEELPEIVFSLDLEGHCVHINSAVSHLLGYDPSDMINANFSTYIASPAQKQNFEDFLRHSATQVNFRSILTLQTALGIEADFHVEITLMEGELLCGNAKKIGMGMNQLDWKTEQQSEIKSEIEEEQQLKGSSVKEQPLPPQVGPYRVTSLLGEGSMGRVYKGFDEHLERDVAIKMINRAFASDTEHLERFKREARLLASISHPNIALIYFFDVWKQLPFFCMEYLPEGSIDQLLKTKHVLDPMTATLFIQQAALGLKTASEKGIVHLDIKPSNLMVAEKNRIKIVDFGLATTHKDLEESSNKIVGTPAYMAPEQLNGGLIDHRCDIYSLGITYFEMVYGFVPYSGNTLKETFTRKLTEELPAAETLNPAVPLSVLHLIRKMVECDPNNRIQNYSELVDKLEEIKRNMHGTADADPSPKERSVRRRADLYDTSFADILGNIWRDQFTGRLSLHWLDLNKVIHFKNGMITSVLSNQEGERFVDLLIFEKYVRPDAGSKIQNSGSDLFTKYSSAIELVSNENRENLRGEFQNLAWKILESLFSWVAGEFILEQGIYPDQPGFELSTSDVITRGIRYHTDFSVISRRISKGNVRITMAPQCINRVRQVRLTASERLLLLKTDGGILFSELHTASNLPAETLGRLVYLFLSLGFVQFEPVDAQPASNPLPALPQQTRPVRAPMPIPHVEQRQQKFDLKTGPPPPAGDLAEQYARQAAEDYVNEQYWSAVQHCKKALEIKADSRIYHLMGRALGKHQGFRYDAMKALRTAQELTPENLQIPKDIADLHLSCGNIALAEAHYKRILKTHPRDKHCIEQMRNILHRNDFSKVVSRTVGKFFASRKDQPNP